MKLVLLIGIIVIGVYGYSVFSKNPTVITNPVYMESRVILDIPNSSRELEVVFLGEMTSQEDCTRRSEKYLPNLLKNCQICTIKSTECKTEIHRRNKKLFSDSKTNTTYLSLTKSNRFERNGRVVVWGLSDEEAKQVCSTLKSNISDDYKGTKNCI